MVTKHEQKSKALKLHFNYGMSNQTMYDSRNGEWNSHMASRYLRVEMIGWLTDYNTNRIKLGMMYRMKVL